MDMPEILGQFQDRYVHVSSIKWVLIYAGNKFALTCMCPLVGLKIVYRTVCSIAICIITFVSAQTEM